MKNSIASSNTAPQKTRIASVFAIGCLAAATVQTEIVNPRFGFWRAVPACDLLAVASQQKFQS